MPSHILWVEPEEKELEKTVRLEYSSDEVRKHLEYLTSLTRLAGTEDELKAANYIKSKLDEYGVDSEIYEFDAYLSYPGKAEFEIRSPVQKSFPCLAHAFIAPTPPEGIEADLLSLGKGTEKDYQGVEARGKIVLIEPGSGAGQVKAAGLAEQRGAAAQIHITNGKNRSIMVMQLRDTWGSPAPDTIDRILKAPAISICEEDGREIQALTKQGHVVARLKADAWRGYKKIRQPVGTLMGAKEPKKYVLCSAHYCSWFGGATDNAAANSLLLEMARVFSKHKGSLIRGIRFVWWAGQTQGTFAGSTWFVDHFWDDIRDNAVAYLDMDSIGRGGSSKFEARNTEEIRRFQESVIKEILGEDVKSIRVPRTGDQSYWGMGLPSFTGRTSFAPEYAKSQGGEPYWYLHTAQDTLDKVDLEQIEITFRVNSPSILRLCNNPVLPFEFVTLAKILKNRLNDLQKDNHSDLDLTPLIHQADQLEQRAEALNEDIEKNLFPFGKKKGEKGFESKCGSVNACLMGLSRILIPLLSSRSGKYGQDPMGTPFKPIPPLQRLEQLNLMDKSSEEYRALRTSLLRGRNRVSDSLFLANSVLSHTLNKM